MDDKFRLVDDILKIFVVELQEALDDIYMFANSPTIEPFVKNAALLRINKYIDVWLKAHFLTANTFHKDVEMLMKIKEEIAFNNIGIDVLDELHKLEHIHTNLTLSKLFMAMHVLKSGYNIIPEDTKRCIVDTMNNIITKRNQVLPPSQRYLGKIICIKPSSHGNYVCTSVNWICNDCDFIWSECINSQSDIICPHTCASCTSSDIDVYKKKKDTSWKEKLKMFFLCI